MYKETSSKPLPVVEKGVVMAKDSKLWEQSYESYKKRFPKSKHNNKKPKTRDRQLPKEPMLLLEDYRKILNEIQLLTKKRQRLRTTLRKHGIDPVNYTRSNYFDRPILLYILKLKHNCWYVGMSRNVDRRFKAHLKGATIWTKEHPPIEIVEVRETGLTSDSEASILEDELTIEYARRYGTEYVRGGGYCQRKPKWPELAYEPIVDIA